MDYYLGKETEQFDRSDSQTSKQNFIVGAMAFDQFTDSLMYAFKNSSWLPAIIW